MMLCQTCSKITLTKPAGKVCLREYKDVAALELLSDQGCELCALVRKSHHDLHVRIEGSRAFITQPVKPEDLRHSEIRVFHNLQDKIELESNVFWECRQELSRTSSTFTGNLGGFYTDEGDVAAMEIRGREVTLHPSSDETMKRAITWLNSCIVNHPECSKKTSTFFPTRLIEIDRENGIDRVRLMHPSKHHTGVYVALSYCWGSARQGLLLSENVASRSHGFPLTGQPQTIQDAVHITSSLGLRYIWIDSLCIIQDSSDDWEKESATMCDVYNHAYLTLQASVAASASDGFLFSRAGQPLPAAKLPYKTQNGQIGSLWVRSKLLVDRLTTEPVDRRGWTYQEGLLSPRILAFGSTEVSWECKTTFVSEGGSTLWDVKSLVGLPKPIRLKSKTHYLPVDLPVDDPRTARSMTWYLMVQEYTTRTLSFEKDKLPALSGLAKLISTTRPGDQYLAGMWRNDFPENLRWGIQHNARRPSEYRAPSWSWASVEGHITVFGEENVKTTIHCTVVNVNVTYSTLNPFGEVSAGVLSIRAPVKQGWRILSSQMQPGDQNVQPFFDSPRVLTPEESALQLKLGLVDIDFVDPEQELHQTVSNWYMRLYDDEGLVLRLLADGSFERVGLFMLDVGKEGWFDGCEVREIKIL